jgi:hypothetical protein
MALSSFPIIGIGELVNPSIEIEDVLRDRVEGGVKAVSNKFQRLYFARFAAEHTARVDVNMLLGFAMPTFANALKVSAVDAIDVDGLKFFPFEVYRRKKLRRHSLHFGNRLFEVQLLFWMKNPNHALSSRRITMRCSAPLIDSIRRLFGVIKRFSTAAPGPRTVAEYVAGSCGRWITP